MSATIALHPRERARRAEHLAATLCREIALAGEPADVVMFALTKALASSVVTTTRPEGYGVLSNACAGLIVLEIQQLAERRGSQEVAHA
jgi:hypothetical protein